MLESTRNALMSDTTASIFEQLAVAEERTYRVNWLTYAHDLQDGKLGLGMLLAQAYESSVKEIETESSNDTDYRVDVRNPKPFMGSSMAGVREKMRKGFISEYELNMAMAAAVEDGFLPAGIYVVSMSW